VSWFYRAVSNPAADAAIQSMRREAMGAEVPMFGIPPRAAAFSGLAE
jgi:lauroyl/myristoyl acyltransferase